MIRRPPRSTRLTHSFPTRRSSDLAQAILYPTPANVTAYIRFQREQLDRASLFSDVWQRALWQDPALDYTLERPVGALAKRQWQDARAAERDVEIGRAQV